MGERGEEVVEIGLDVCDSFVVHGFKTGMK